MSESQSLKPTEEELLELFDLIYRTGDTDTPTCIEFARVVLERWGKQSYSLKP